MSSFPSRDDVLALLTQIGRPASAQDLAQRAGVPSTPGFLRYMDNLALEGVINANADDKFSLRREKDSVYPAEVRAVPQKGAGRAGAGQPAGREAPYVNRAAPPEFRNGPLKAGGGKGRAAPAEQPRRAPADRPSEQAMPGFSVAGDKPGKRDAGGPREPRAFLMDSPLGRKSRFVEKARPDNAPPKKGLPAPSKHDLPRREAALQGAQRTQFDTLPKAARNKAPQDPTQQSLGTVREGIVSVNARGFGFVATGATDGDLFVPAESLGGAMHGDRVRATIVGRSSRGLEGSIVEVLTRGKPRVSGILRRRGRDAWVEPDDTRVRGPIALSRAVDIQGPAGNSGDDGDLVVVKITRHPESSDDNPEGELIAVLGRPGELLAEMQKTLLVAGIEETHSDEAIAEAEAYGETVPESMLAGREDLTHIPLPTIDPEDARDHDDAVWVERTPTGYRAWIAIADVSSYVRPGTKIDAESLVRGCSVYLPDRAIPMLPRALSSNLCSLLPDVIRLCLCAVVDLDKHGHVENTRIVRGFMKSAAKLTYGGVARALGLTQEPPVDPKAEAMVDGLRVAQELSLTLRALRMQRGALDFDLPEPKIIFDENKVPIDVKKRSQDPGMKKAYQLIEELMLLGNEVIARFLVQHDLPGVFRVHLAPDEKKLAKLQAMCAVLGVPFDLEDTKEPKRLAALVKMFTRHEQAQVLSMLLLRSMKQAAYDIENLGHFGLASEAYLHFTSPIRRYPDLVVHRIVHQAVLGQPIDKSEAAIEKLQEAALQASMSERRAMEVEREITDLYRCIVMRPHIGESFAGVVTSITGHGLYVALDDPFVDVLVRFDDLGDEAFEADDEGLRVTALRSGDTIALGDVMVVEVIDVALERRSILGRRAGQPVRRFAQRGGPDGKSARGGVPSRRVKNTPIAASHGGPGPGPGPGKSETRGRSKSASSVAKAARQGSKVKGAAPEARETKGGFPKTKLAKGKKKKR